jgi:hypothetical protein
MVSDFLDYIDMLISFFRLSEKLDAAGDTLSRIFTDFQKPSELKLKEFKNWIFNFDIWGSYLPLTSESWDLHTARATSYEKLSIFRASLRDFLRQNKRMLKNRDTKKYKESTILTTLMTNLSIVEFYFAKIESYLRRKHDSALKTNEDSQIIDSEISDPEADTENVLDKNDTDSGESLIK